MRYEKVYTLEGWYDGPRSGVADYKGKPHIYESNWREDEDLPYLYDLKPINKSELKLVMEMWNIWKRWEKANINGKVPDNTHPALPEDKARYKELEKLLKPLYEIDYSSSIKAKGEFKAAEQSESFHENDTKMVVGWKEVIKNAT